MTTRSVYRIVLWDLDWSFNQDTPVKSIADIVEIDSMDDGHGGRCEPTEDYLREFALDRRRVVFGERIAGGDDDPLHIELAYQRVCEIVVEKLPVDYADRQTVSGETLFRIPDPDAKNEDELERPSEREALMMLAKATMNPFSEFDYQGFAGVNSDNPMIGETEDEQWIIILDGDVLSLATTDGREFQYVLKEVF